MAQLTSQYLNYALQSLIVSTLEKDGAVCNFFAKNYDEKETYNGGTGFRKAFKIYNDKIIDYHTLLKVLTGEQRANIRESIPSIDYLNRENTSLLYTYDVKDNGELDTTTIRSASKEEKTALDLILNEDPFLINRAIVGELPAEHFYNSTGNATTPSIQTSPWMGNSNVEYLYRGIYGDTLRVSDKTFAAPTTKISMHAFETPSPDDSDTSGYSTGSAYIKFTSNSKNVDDDVIVKLEKQDVRVLYTNTDGGTFAYVDSALTGTCKNSAGITLDKKDFYTVDDSKFFKSLKDEEDEPYEYQIELTSEDICTLLPKTILGGLATLVVFKKDSSTQATENVKSLTWGPYRLATTEDDGTKKLQNPVEDCISSLSEKTTVTKGDIYHLASYPDEAFDSDTSDTDTIRNSSNAPNSIPENLLADTDIIFIGETGGDSSNKANWKILGNAYKAFYIPITSYSTTSSFEEIKVNDKLPSYLERTGVYSILQSLVDIEKIYLADASGLLSGFYEEPYRRDGVLVEDETEVPSTTSTVTKWKFVDDVDTAKARGVSIDVGSKYFKGHLLGRGYFDDEPLRLTEGDYTLGEKDNSICFTRTDDDGKKHLIRKNGNFEYKGKVLLTYDILSNATSSLFNKVQIENFNTFPIRSLDDVVTRADYDGRTYSGAEAKNLLSDDDYSKMVKSGNYKYESILNYPEKLNALNEDDSGKNIADSEQILKYITDLIGSINTEDKNSYSLYLDLTDEDGPCVSSRTSYQTTVTKVKVPNFKTDNCGHVKQDGYKDQEIPSTLVNTVPTGGSLGDIYTQLNKTFAVSYEVKLKGITSKDIDDANAGKISLSDIKEQEGNAFNFNIKMITPMEVFSTKNHYITSKFVDVYNGSKSFRSESKLATSERIIPTGTILVYPEYSKYLPTTMFLLSKTDLGLEVENKDGTTPSRSMVSFVAKRTNSQPNSVVSFKVTSVREFKPSKIKKVTLKTGDNKYETVDYKYGLYPAYKVNAVQTVTGFETIRVSLNSTSVTNSQGISFNFQDIINGVYSVAAGNERIVYNYATVGASSDTNSALKMVKSVKAINRLNALMTAMSSEEEEEETSSTTTESSDVEIRTNNLTSRETSATKNASGVESAEKDIASTKNQANPGYGIADASNTNFVRGYSYNKKSNVTITSVSNTNTSDEEGTVSMGGSSNIPEATQSGFNTYYMDTEDIQRCWSYLSQDPNKRRSPYNWVYVDVPKYSTTSYEYVPSVSDAYDCYIYVLEPMTLELDSIELYDQKNNKISFSDISNVEIIPMSYPSSFFAVSTLKDSTNQTVYQLKNRKDVTSLKDRLIVPGLPNFTIKEDLLTKYTRGIPMEPIANMIFSKDSSTNQVINSILGNAIYSVLKSWKLSGLSETAGTVNSLLLEDFPEMVKGLVEAKPVLRKLSNAGFTVNLGESQYTITPNDINTIISRITDEDVVYKREYTVTRDASRGNTEWLSSLASTSGDDYQKAFIEEAKNRLNGIKVEYSRSKTGVSRPSLKRIAVEVEKAFSTSNSLDENLCKTLDSFFGNDTKAFLTLGASEETDVSDSSLNLIASENTLTLGNKINEEFESVILEMALEVANKKNEAEINNKVCPIFSKYLSGQPTSWSSSVDAIESTVKTKGKDFKLLGYSSSLTSAATYRKLLESIKNNYRNYYKYSTQPYYWRRMSFDRWVRVYALNCDESEINNYSGFWDKSSWYWLFSYRSSYNLRNRILIDLRNLVYQQITSEIRAIYNSGSVNMPSISQLATYIGEVQSGETHFNSTFGILNETPLKDEDDPEVIGGNFCVTEIIPYYDVDTNSFKALTKFSTVETNTGYKPKTPYLSKDPGSGTTFDVYADTSDEFANLARQTFPMYSEPKSDAKVIVLKGIANYVKTALEGTGSDRYYVKYVKGDSKVSGRTNSLYYKRYLALNNRLNTAEGTLSSLLAVYRNQSALNSSDEYAQNVSESYADKLAVIPVSRFSELTWMAPTKATGTSIAIPGKFYYKRELEALRNQIGDQCILTCNKCNVQNSCPFYNPEEIIKLYCTPAETIDLYFKDNELDLIAYTEEEETDENGNTITKHYPDVWETSTDGESKSSIDVDKLKNMHTYYNDILSKVEGDTSKSQQFTGRDIQQVREELEKNAGTCEFDSVVDGENLGYLVGARYGTVRRNNMMVLANNDESFTEFGKTANNPLPTYQYLYDAIYIKDEETYFNYKTSSQKYDVAFETGPAHNKKHYEGKTRIKIPTSLKILESASPNDLVYLISDDKYDDSGNSITPIVYLGRVKNLQWTINMVEEPTRSVQNEYDSNAYASDIAQWCMNYYKGTCVEDPIGDIGNDPSNPSKPMEEDQDQYWMEEIKKKVIDSDGTESWITLEGRPRENTGYSEPLMDPEALNEAKVACGKPVVANYINFIRKFSIRIYNGDYAGQYDEAGNYLDDSVWTIPWVKGITSKERKSLVDGKYITWDTQRAALQFMKTNLRLVVVKNG